MFSFFSMYKGNSAAGVGVFTGEHYIASHFLHGEVTDVAQGPAAGRAAGQLGAAAGAHQVATLALQDGRQNIVEAYGALEQRGEVGRHGGGHTGQRRNPRHSTTGTASSPAPLARAHVTVTRTYVDQRSPINRCTQDLTKR